MLSKTRILNIFGGPGIGKSLSAAKVFSELKQNHINCELVTEIAKDIVWEDTTKLLDNQIWLFSEQFRRQWRLLDKVDYVVTDSPLLMYSVYLEQVQDKLPNNLKFSIGFYKKTVDFFESSFKEFNNLNFFLERYYEVDKWGEVQYTTYSDKGRSQTIKQALELDNKICMKAKSCVDHIEKITSEYDKLDWHPITKRILTMEGK